MTFFSKKKKNEILEECPDTLGISDDVWVYVKTEEEQNENLRTVMEVSKRRGLVFNKDKCHIKKDTINFYGPSLGLKGSTPIIIKMCKYLKKTITQKRDRTTTILGLVQFMSTLIPCLNEITQPLRALLHKDVEWQWTSSHDQAFIKLKDLILV